LFNFNESDIIEANKSLLQVVTVISCLIYAAGMNRGTHHRTDGKQPMHWSASHQNTASDA